MFIVAGHMASGKYATCMHDCVCFCANSGRVHGLNSQVNVCVQVNIVIIFLIKVRCRGPSSACCVHKPVSLFCQKGYGCYRLKYSVSCLFYV